MARKKNRPNDADRLPATIYVRWSDHDPEDRYLDATETAAGHSEADATVRVGVYELVRYADVVNRTEVKDLPKK